MKTVHQNAAAHHEHGDGAHHPQGLHQPGGKRHQTGTEPAQEARPRALPLALRQMQPRVVQLDDTRHQAVNTHRHHQSDTTDDQDLGNKTLPGDDPQGQDDDLRR